RGELRRPPGHPAGGLEELDVLGVRARPAALDVGHAVLVEHPGDPELVGEAQGDVLALGPVAERRVVEGDGSVGRCGRHRSDPVVTVAVDMVTVGAATGVSGAARRIAILATVASATARGPTRV